MVAFTVLGLNTAVLPQLQFLSVIQIYQVSQLPWVIQIMPTLLLA
jgi:hypothetical protein